MSTDPGLKILFKNFEMSICREPRDVQVVHGDCSTGTRVGVGVETLNDGNMADIAPLICIVADPHDCV